MIIQKTDVLVVGTGIAGLTAALNIENTNKVVVISKDKIRGNNSFYAQGGVAVVFRSPDTVTLHKEDTIKAGAGLSKPEIVDLLVGEGPQRIKELIDLGLKFERNADNNYDLLKEGAHSERRIMHVADKTGFSIENLLIRKIKATPNVQIKENMFLENLIVQDKKCYGAVLVNIEDNEEIAILSDYTILATGGAGDVYSKNTNHYGSTGDGLVAAYKAGAEIEGMEFYQFHPTAIELKRKNNDSRYFLISEAVRGEGAIISNDKNERFLFKYDERGELAPRDIVARAIYNELQSGQQVYLDLTVIDGDLKKRFPVIYRSCLRYGYDITKTKIPVVPVAHYMIGGVVADKDAKTNINNLYACGEVASSGVHGANRLASNSMLECIVFGYRAALDINKSGKNIEPAKGNIHKNLVDRPLGLATSNITNIKLLRIELAQLMYSKVGIVRTSKQLEEALVFINMNIDKMKNNEQKSIYAKETLNLLLVSKLIAESALKRKVSIGSHFILP